MKNVLCLTMFLAASTFIHAQTAVAPARTAQAGTAPTGIDGTWRFEAEPNPWTATLKAEGLKLTGTVTSCSSARGAIDIFDGQIDGNAITFKCKSLDNARTLTFTGKVNGDEIAVAWERAGAGGNNFDATIFSESAPRQFTAKRTHLVMWTGTFQNVNGEGVVNKQKNPASIELKQVRDPHSAWRDKGELTVATWAGGGNYELATFVVTEQKLSYWFNRFVADEPSRKDDLVECLLPRRADGAYEGDCKGPGFNRHVTLSPPAPAGSK